MMGPTGALLPPDRLHLQHGPIDLIVGADGDRAHAFAAAKTRFETVLEELVTELPVLRMPAPTPQVQGKIAQRMQEAVARFDRNMFVTAMAAVAGSVAEAVLEAMVNAADLDRAYVNNGGDIALHLTPGQRFKMAMAAHNGRGLGHINIGHDDPVRGIATSGRHGRSHSLGIADSVTVLAKSAAVADVAATLIANAIDLPGHPQVKRTPAAEHDRASDLQDQFVVTGCGPLTKTAPATALANGAARAGHFQTNDHITGACLFLNGQSRAIGANFATLQQGTLEHA